MADLRLIARIEELRRLAEGRKISRDHNAAKSAMREARDLWKPMLGVPKPDFTRPQRPQTPLEVSGRAMATPNLAIWTKSHWCSQEIFDFTCPICVETLSGTCYKHDTCQNIFCCTCLESWLARSLTCPLCRADVPPMWI